MHHRGKTHPRQAHIHAIDGLAGDNVRVVVARHTPPDELEILGVFEFDRLGIRNGKVGGIGDEFAVTELFRRIRRMQHKASFCPAGVGRDIPAAGRRLDQHGARGGTGPPQRFPGPQTAAAAGALKSIARWVKRCRLHGNLLPVRIQFFGYQHGQAGTYALPHFGLVDSDENAPIRANGHEGIGSEHRGGGIRRRPHPVRLDVAAKCQGHPGQRRPGQKLASGKVDNQRHDRFSPFCNVVARCTAARIRWYVPHRQRFPAMALAMSSSVGLGLAASSAAAAMTCPGWQ